MNQPVANTVQLGQVQIHPAAQPAFNFFYQLQLLPPPRTSQYDGHLRLIRVPNATKPFAMVSGLKAHFYAKHGSQYALFQLSDETMLTPELIARESWRDVLMMLRYADPAHHDAEQLFEQLQQACPDHTASQIFDGGLTFALIRLMLGNLRSQSAHANA